MKKKEIKRTTYCKVNYNCYVNGDTALAPYGGWVLKLIEYKDGTYDIWNQDGSWLILEDCGAVYVAENGWEYIIEDLFYEPLTILKSLK